MDELQTLDEVKNYYDEFNQQGKNPKDYDPADFIQRKRGKEFNERYEAAQKRIEAHRKAMEKYKSGK